MGGEEDRVAAFAEDAAMLGVVVRPALDSETQGAARSPHPAPATSQLTLCPLLPTEKIKGLADRVQAYQRRMQEVKRREQLKQAEVDRLTEVGERHRRCTRQWCGGSHCD